VSGVAPKDVEASEDTEASSANESQEATEEANKEEKTARFDTSDKEQFQAEYEQVKQETKEQHEQKDNFLMRFSKGIGGITGTFYQAGRDSFDTLIKNLLPFMAFVSMLIGIINYTGIG